MRPLLALLPFVLLLTACQSESANPPEEIPSIPFRVDGTMSFLRDGETLVTIDIEVADTDSARNRGLMQRFSLPDRSGMLFVFPEPEPQNFWMANTQLSLDFFFVNTDSQIVSISKYAKPLSPESVTSQGIPVPYVIEVEAGFIDTYGIIESDRVTWERTDGM